MRVKHIQIIGVPKTGTTWLWRNLVNTTELSIFRNHIRNTPELLEIFHTLNNKVNHPIKIIKESAFQDQLLADYIKYYSAYDVTINAYPFTFRLDNKQISNIHNYTTDLFLILRNPYELLCSWKNFYINKYQSDSGWIPEKAEFIQFQKIITKWRNAKIPLNILYYDDLTQDSISFFRNFCRLADLTISDLENFTTNTIAKTHYEEYLRFDSKQIIEINKIILETQELVDKDLTHWLQ